MYNKTNQLTNNPDYIDYFIQIVTDQRYKCPAYELSEIYSRFGNVFTFLYGYQISTSSFAEKYEAVHRDDLAMMFGEPLTVKNPPLISPNSWSSTNHNYSVEERVISEQFINLWTNFIVNDDPNVFNSSLKWLEFKRGKNDDLRNILYLNGSQTK